MTSLKNLSFVSGLLLIALFGQLSNAKEITIIDQDEATFDVERVAQVVCEVTKGADKQISRFSTIQSLIDFFKSISSDHKLAECAHQYLPAIEHMQLILSTANKDVCSDTKISLIESFHRNFVSKARKYRKEQKANQLVAPKLLKLFYMHYASAVSATCARSAVQELQAVEFDKKTNNVESGKMIEQISNIFGKPDASNGYKDMFLVWNFVDSLPVEQDSKLSRYLHKGKARVYLQVQKAEGLKGVQDSCRKKLRPFYSLSILPVIRLADLGFYPEDETLVQMLVENPNYRELYSLVQLCETILPVQLVENEKLGADQLVVLSKDQTSSIDSNVDDEEEMIGLNPANKVEALETVNGTDSKVFIKRVKANVDSRASAQNKILRRIILKYKGESSSKTSKVTLSDGQSESEDFSSLLHQHLAKTEESAPLRALESDEDDEEKSGSVMRGRRGIGSFIRHTFAVVVATLLTVVYLALWVVFLAFKIAVIAPSLIFTLLTYELIGDNRALANLCTKLWETKLSFFPKTVYNKMIG